ncbi:Rv3654c family TadE-like protein [Flexivirga sp. B27]
MSDANHQSPERGSATVLVVMSIGVVLLCLAGALALLSAVQASHRARAAADLAALAGARALVGSHATAAPCEVAAGVATQNGGALVECTVAGDDIMVDVSCPASWPGLGRATARARAGPDPAPDSSSAPAD